MSKNIESIEKYLSSLMPTGDPTSDLLLTIDEQEDGFLVSPWINYTLESDGYPNGNFLIRLRYQVETNLFQVQFWGRDFYNEWIGTNKHIFVSLLTNRINNKLNLGSWWLDLDDGSIAVVSSLIVSENGIHVESIKANINGLVRTLRQYYPILVRYVKSDGEPEDYNNALEALENSSDIHAVDVAKVFDADSYFDETDINGLPLRENSLNNIDDALETSSKNTINIKELNDLYNPNANGPGTDSKARPTQYCNVTKSEVVLIKKGTIRNAKINNEYFLLAEDINHPEYNDEGVRIKVKCYWYNWKPKNTWMGILVNKGDYERIENFTGVVVVNLGR